MRTARPFSTVTSMAQVSGQSWGQTARMTSTDALYAERWACVDRRSSLTFPLLKACGRTNALISRTHRMSKRPLVIVFSSCARPLMRAANWPDRPTLRAVRATTPAVDRRRSLRCRRGRTRRSSPTSRSTIRTTAQPATMRTSVRIAVRRRRDLLRRDDGRSRQRRRRCWRAATRSCTTRLPLASTSTRSTTACTARRSWSTPSNVQIDIDPLQRHRRGHQLGRGVGVGGEDRRERLDRRGAHAVLAAPLPGQGRAHAGASTSRRRHGAQQRVGAHRQHAEERDRLRLALRRPRRASKASSRGARSSSCRTASRARDVRTRADRDESVRSRRCDHRIDAGLDLKYALTSSLTLTGTINPDFGQVEVDPAVVNLSQFETFFPEKRPFFTEGAEHLPLRRQAGERRTSTSSSRRSSSTRAASAARRRARSTRSSSPLPARRRSSAPRRSPASSGKAGPSASSTRSPTRSARGSSTAPTVGTAAASSR